MKKQLLLRLVVVYYMKSCSIYGFHYIKHMSPVNKHLKKKAAPSRPSQMGRKLRTLRTAEKLTLDQLAKMAGVSKAMLSQIEQDKVNPTVAVMLKVGDALKVPISDLLEAPESHNITWVAD